MDCDVARESLSARIDGEREPVPSARTDEHLLECQSCAAWYRIARGQSRVLAALAAADPDEAVTADTAQPRTSGATVAARYALAAVGVIQLSLALAQALGVDFGLVAAHHGAATGAHLLNESTAWSAALGVTMIVAALRSEFAPGVVCVGGVYVLGLAYYVAVDSVAGHVTAARIATHAAVVLGVVLAFFVWRGTRTRAPTRRRGVDVGAESGATDPLSERRRRKLGIPNNSAA